MEGPEGVYRTSARYLVGCDGARSAVRELSGIAFPGMTYPEVNRLAQVTLPEPVTVGEEGVDVPGFGLLAAGFTRTGSGLFGLAASADSPVVSLYTAEDEGVEYDDDVPMTVPELQDSLRRVLGVELPVGEAHRLSRFTFKARQAERYRRGRIMLAGDAAHQFPATGVAINSGMLDAVNLAWKLAAETPEDLLDSYHDERHLAGARTLLHTRAQVALRRGHDPAADALRELFEELLLDEQPLRRMGSLLAGSDIRYPMPGCAHPLAGLFAPDLTLHGDEGTTSVARLMRDGRPVLLDLADRADVREAARGWAGRVDVVTAKADPAPADAILIRPDAHVAWAVAAGEPVEGLREALGRWFGA